MTFSESNLPPHFRILLSIELFPFGSWDNENGYVYIEDSATPLFTLGPIVGGATNDNYCTDSIYKDA